MKKLIVTVLTEDLVLIDRVVQRFAARATLLLDAPPGREGRPTVRSEMETNHLSLFRCSWCDSAQVNDYSATDPGSVHVLKITGLHSNVF